MKFRTNKNNFSSHLTRPGAELLFPEFEGLCLEWTDVELLPKECDGFDPEIVTDAAIVRIWIVLVGGRDVETAVIEAVAETIVFVEEQVRVFVDAEVFASLLSNSKMSSHNFCTLFTERVSLSVSSVSAGTRPKCSEELLEKFRDFFFLRGGATGPEEVMESVVLDCASLVLAITSGSWSIIPVEAEDCSVADALATPALSTTTSWLWICLGETRGVLDAEEELPDVGSVEELTVDMGSACWACCFCWDCSCAFNEARDSRSTLIALKKCKLNVRDCFYSVYNLNKYRMDQCCQPIFCPHVRAMSCYVYSSHRFRWP